jgi:flagellar hook-associated protein 3 FlgL
MNFVSVGDMAQMFKLQRQNVAIKSEMSRLTEELTTGVASDVGATLRGDFSTLSGIDRSLRTLEAYKFASQEAESLSGTMQAVTDTLSAISAGFSSALLTAGSSGSNSMIDAAANSSREKFSSAVSALNSNSSGRFVFSGQATDISPLAEADTILSALSSLVAPETTASGVIAAVDSWFNAPAGSGGYLDVAYQGGSAFEPFRIGEGEQTSLSITAADEDVRDFLKSLSIGALLAEGLFAGDTANRALIATAAGEQVLTAASSLADIGAKIGASQEHIENVLTRNSAETASLAISRNQLIAVDTYDSATALQALQTQMETLYTLTARLANLSLTDYM